MARSAAKIILLGEHAVVHGVPAIAAGLEKGAVATAVAAPIASLTLGDRPSVGRDESEVGRGFSAILDYLRAPPCAVRVDLEIPPGVGLGASAAIAVAIARAVLDLQGVPRDLDRTVEAAMCWERVFHGNPSGVDAAAATHGGCIRYRKGEGIRAIRLARDLQLAIAVAGPPASTRVMVEGVAELKRKKPEMVQKSFDAIESLVNNAALCLEAGDLPGLGKLLDLNHMLCAGLLLSTEQLESACHYAREAGALGAKLTGAGGGGCVLALADRDPEPILTAWRAHGLLCFSSVVRAHAPSQSEY